VRRAVAFAEAVYAGQVTVEGVTARLAPDAVSGMAYAVLNEIAVIVDADGLTLGQLRPPILVDARLAKRRLDTTLRDAPFVVGLGPGFEAGVDCHAVVETQRGHDLGRVSWRGTTAPDSGWPEPVGGLAEERVLRAPLAGVFTACKLIGDEVKQGEVVALVDYAPLVAQCSGVLRGVVHDGLHVSPGLKVGDIDPRGVRDYCFTISDKARAVGGGVLEAILAGARFWRREPPPEIRDRGLP
jgi:xanthine dehydrogenase accessory factor